MKKKTLKQNLIYHFDICFEKGPLRKFQACELH